MANPTRDDIEAKVLHPKYKVELWSPDDSQWFTIPNNYIAEANGAVETTGNSDNGMSFGNAVEPTATVITTNAVLGGADNPPDKLLEDTYWLRTRMRISFTFNDADFVTAFVGIVVNIAATYNQVTFELVSMLEYIRKTKLYTNLQFKRPIATRTTSDSIEDADNPEYKGGTINEIFWRAGGRPYEQIDDYPEAAADFNFYYSCTNSICSPEWTWLSGENLEEELYSLARAAGGQIYQDNNGVVRYINPLAYGTQEGYSSFYTLGNNLFESSERRYATTEKVAAVNCLYTARSIQPITTIYEENKPRLFQIAETLTLELTTQLPIYEYINLDATIFSATYFDGNVVTPTIDYVLTTATKITLIVTNPSTTQPMIIHNVKIAGRPLEAAEENLVVTGSGLPAMNVDNNPYIQSRYHAAMLGKMLYDFYNAEKLNITLNGHVFDTDRYVGELVYYVYEIYLGNGNYESDINLRRITKIQYDNTGTSMNIDLVSIVGYPIKEDHYIVGRSYVADDVRLLSY